MSSPLQLQLRRFPARVADLGFTAHLPADWISHELPGEEVDFSNPTNLMPLGVVSAPHAAIVFAFAARPAYDDGSLQEWAWYLLRHHQLQPRAVGQDIVAGVPAVCGEAVQSSELGPLTVRFAFLEDGNRLLNLTLTAPEMFADAVRDAWFSMLKSFTLESPRGSRFQIEAPAERPSGAPLPDPSPEAQPTAEAGESAVPVGELGMRQPAGVQPKKCKFSDFALSEDTHSLAEEHAVNLSLRNRGIGLVPNLAGRSDAARRATLAAGAIMARVDVPYGWHALDDGKRTLIFEPSGKVQIHLNLIPRKGQSAEAILDAIEAEMRRDYPQPEFIRVQQGRIHALGARNIADGEQALEQYHLLHPFRDDTLILRARVTATPDQATDACNLAELILDSCVFASGDPPAEAKPEPSSAPAPQKSPDGKPQWWHNALALEADNRLTEAEKHIRDHCPYIGFAYSTAEMYRLRMLRLKGTGDEAGAREAFKKASAFIRHYASLATSGGEGAALSDERDQFRARLVADYGSDLEAGT